MTVGEGSGHRRDTQFIAERSGLLDLLRDVDAPFVDLNTAPVRRVALDSQWTALGELWLPAPVLDADLVVSMPKLKTHHWGGVTLSLKNCFGMVPSRIYGWPKNVLHWAGLTARSSTSPRRCVPASRSSTASWACRATDRSRATRSTRA